MSYQATTFNTGAPPGIDAPVLNAMQTQYSEASLTLAHELVQPFVLYGLVATKDGVTANQLDVTAGVAFLTDPFDATRRERAPTSTTFTTASLNATYHLYLQPDGTWYWSTSNSPAANSLFIAQVTTDGAGNIATVTDERVLNTTLFANALGTLGVPGVKATRWPSLHVTSTAPQTVLTYTTGPVAGLYRVTARVRMGNIGNELLTLSVAYTDADVGGSVTEYLYNVSLSVVTAAAAALMDGANPHAPAVRTGMAVVAAAPNTAITVTYQDPADSPNDYVSASIERIA